MPNQTAIETKLKQCIARMSSRHHFSLFTRKVFRSFSFSISCWFLSCRSWSLSLFFVPSWEERISFPSPFGRTNAMAPFGAILYFPYSFSIPRFLLFPAHTLFLSQTTTTLLFFLLFLFISFLFWDLSCWWGYTDRVVASSSSYRIIVTDTLLSFRSCRWPKVGHLIFLIFAYHFCVCCVSSSSYFLSIIIIRCFSCRVLALLRCSQ